MPRSRTWSGESRNPGKSWNSLEPLPAPLLTESEVRRRRLELCEEMLQLVLADGGLAARPRQTLVRIHASLGTVRRQL
jgi:hypothetical protein